MRPEDLGPILYVNTSDRGGGAERVAWELFTQIRKCGVEAVLAVGLKRTDHPRVLEIPLSSHPWGRFWDRCWRLIDPLRRKYRWVVRLGHAFKGLAEPARFRAWQEGLECVLYTGSRDLLGMDHKPHLVHFHNLHGGYFDIRALPVIAKEVPVVITLHDQWLYTGHCASVKECHRWMDGCGECPDISRYPSIRKDATRQNHRMKLQILKQVRPHLVLLCEWSRRQVEASGISFLSTRVIPNGVDLEIFRPGPKDEARQKIGGLSLGEHVVLFQGNRADGGGSSKREPGIIQTILTRMGQSEEIRPLCILILGGEKQTDYQMGSLRVREIPFQADPSDVALCYRAADIYIHPSNADTFPLATLEAMACGTPVVSTAVGGVPEQVIDGKTGYLVTPGDWGSMVDRVAQIIKKSDVREAMIENGIKRVKERFDLKLQVEAHLEYYEDILQHRNNASIS